MTELDDDIARGQQERGTAETAVEVSQARTQTPDPNLDPEQIEAKMVAALVACYEKGDDAPAMVRALLLLQGSKGRKLVFTRFDVMQIFSIWTRKLEGKDRV